MKQNDFEDDGRTVVDMSGTRPTAWYQGFTGLNKNKSSHLEHNVRKEMNHDMPRHMEMTKEESRKFMFSAILAGVTVAVVFIIAFLLFILFCVFIWFK